MTGFKSRRLAVRLVSSCVAWSALAPQIAVAQPKTHTPDAYVCQGAAQCPLFPDFYRESPDFRAAVDRGLASRHIEFPWAAGGVSSPMVPVQVDGGQAVMGRVCEPHWCSHNLAVLFYRNSKRLVGLYTDKADRLSPIGDPTTGEQQLLVDFADRKISPGQVITTDAPGARPPASYGEALNKKFGSRLTYTSQFARQVVEGFDIDCKARDGRSLPLRNVLLAVLKETDHYPKLWLTFRVEARGRTVRVYEVANTPKGPDWEKVYLEINEWRELRLNAVRPEAVLNACFGSFGPIWSLPKR